MSPAARWHRAGDPALEPSSDPGRSRARIEALDADHDPSRRVLGMLDAAGVSLADRTTAPGHLTASAVVVDAARTRVLVLMHTKLRRWLQPGGHADGDHELAGVALREATEETGIAGLSVLTPPISLDIHEVDHGDALGTHLHLDLRFLVAAPLDAVERGNHESTDLRWVTPAELGDLVDDPGLVRLVEIGLACAARAPEPPGGWVS